MANQITISADTLQELADLKEELDGLESKLVSSKQKVLDLEQELVQKRQAYDGLLDGVDENLRRLMGGSVIRELKADVPGTINPRVAKSLKDQLKGEKFISINKKDIQAMANDAGCTVADVEATINSMLVSYNPENKRGRNIRFCAK